MKYLGTHAQYFSASCMIQKPHHEWVTNSVYKQSVDVHIIVQTTYTVALSWLICIVSQVGRCMILLNSL